MKRENIALVARARRDPDACLELGRHYLAGADGFPRHEQLGLEYLSHVEVRDTSAAAKIICAYLPLERIIALGHEALLLRAAQDGCAEASFKLGLWLALGSASPKAGIQRLVAAASQGHSAAQAAAEELRAAESSERDDIRLVSLRKNPSVRLDAIAAAAAEWAAKRGDLHRLARCVRVALDGPPESLNSVAQHVKTALRNATENNIALAPLCAAQIEPCLTALASDSDMEAAYLLGRAYCGIDSPQLAALQVVAGTNLRKGVALLLRAADSGIQEAWSHLHWVHADHRCSVANPQLAKFFLEKAAESGDVHAQRRLGALVLRSACSLKESEQAMQLLHTAASQGDRLASRLMQTLVLPVCGKQFEADKAIKAVQSADPWLAARLKLSRDFGLTKLEALCVDPVAGKRSWGLVVGQNPYIELPKLSAPRAVPAITTAALANLHCCAVLFEAARREGDMREGDYRRRSARQRALFYRHGIDEQLFFARASSTTLESLRIGTKWALKAKTDLTLALAAGATGQGSGRYMHQHALGA